MTFSDCKFFLLVALIGAGIYGYRYRGKDFRQSLSQDRPSMSGKSNPGKGPIVFVPKDTPGAVSLDEAQRQRMSRP